MNNNVKNKRNTLTLIHDRDCHFSLSDRTVLERTKYSSPDVEYTLPSLYGFHFDSGLI